VGGDYYPDSEMMFAPDHGPDVPESWRRFLALREDLLLEYGDNTARAYWGDLQEWFDWAVARDKDFLALTAQDTTQYCALLRRGKYSESTIRQRKTALRLLASRILL
jgi:site-specific recombinase XerD